MRRQIGGCVSYRGFMARQSVILAAAGLGILGPCAAMIYPQEVAKKPLPALHHPDRVSCLAYSPDGKSLAAGTSRTAREIRTIPDDIIRPSEIKLWDTATGLEAASLKGHDRGVTNIAFSPDGKTLASADFGNTIKLWDIASRKELRSYKLAGSIRRIAFSSDLKTVATGSGFDNGVVKLWDLATGKERAVLGSHATKDNPYVQIGALTFSADGKYLASSDFDAGRGDKWPLRPGMVKVWDVAKQKEIASLQGGNRGQPLAWSPDSATLASIDPRGAVRLWDVRTRKVRDTFFGSVACLVFTPDGKTLAGYIYAVEFWDLATGDRSYFEHDAGNNQRFRLGPYAIAISPNSKTLASAWAIPVDAGRREHVYEVVFRDIATAKKGVDVGK